MPKCMKCGNTFSPQAMYCDNCGSINNNAQICNKNKLLRNLKSDKNDLHIDRKSAVRPLSLKLLISIIFLPFIFVWFTLRKGYSLKTRALCFAWFSFLFMMTILPHQHNVNVQNHIVQVESKNTKLINYKIIHTLRIDKREKIYILIDSIDNVSPSFKNDIKKLIEKIVASYGNCVIIDIYDNYEALDLIYRQYGIMTLGRLRTSEETEFLGNHTIAWYEGECDIYPNTLDFFVDNSRFKEFSSHEVFNGSSGITHKPEESRKEKIESMFSGWDGSHKGLTLLIKKSMNDPGSYKHSETVYRDMGNYLIVRTSFRGKNAFGGVVLNSVTAKVDLNGNVLEIIEQE